MKKKILAYCAKKGYKISYVDYCRNGRFWCITFVDNCIKDEITGELINYRMVESNTILDF